MPPTELAEASEATEVVSEQPEAQPVNPALSALFDRAWGKKPGESETPTEPEPAEPKPEPVLEKPKVEKKAPTVQHEDLPPNELLGEVEKPEAEHDDIPPVGEPPPEIKGKGAREQFKVMETKLHQALTELKQLKSAPPAPAQADPASVARVQELEAQLAELASTSEVRRLQAQREFQNNIVAPRQQMLEKAKQLAGMADIDPVALERAIHMQGRAKIEALDEIIESIPSQLLKTQLSGLVTGIDQLDERAQGLLANAKSTNEQWAAQERAEQHQRMQEQEKQFLTLLDSSVGSLREQGFELLKEVPGNEKWNAAVQERVAEARNLLTKNTDPAELSAAAVLATLAPGYRQWALKERVLRIAAEKEIAELKGATPNLGGKTGEPEAAEPVTGARAILAQAWGKK